MLDGEGPEDGSVEAAWEAFCGSARKKRPRPPKLVPAKPEWQPRKKGEKIDRSGADYQRALHEARRGLPDFNTITFLEAVMFDNGEARKPGVPRHRIKLLWTCAPPALVAKGEGRGMRRRFLPLAPRAQARDNWKRPRRGFQIDGEERALIDALLAKAAEEDRIGDGRPPALLGNVQHRFGQEGTIRHSQYGLVRWLPGGEGWLPYLLLARMTGEGFEVLRSRLPDGEEHNSIAMRPGRGRNVASYGNHFGMEFLLYMKPPWMEERAKANLKRPDHS